MKPKAHPRWLGVASRANALQVQQTSAQLLEARQQEREAERVLQTHRQAVSFAQQAWHDKAQTRGFFVQDLQDLQAYERAMRIQAQDLLQAHTQAMAEQQACSDTLGSHQRLKKCLEALDVHWQGVELAGQALAGYREAEQAWASLTATTAISSSQPT